jgi:hypothetical protein
MLAYMCVVSQCDDILDAWATVRLNTMKCVHACMHACVKHFPSTDLAQFLDVLWSMQNSAQSIETAV